MQNSLLFLVKTLSDLYLLTFLLRFVLQWIRADFYNPLAQFVVRVTNPLVRPARRIVPGAAGLDLATLVVMFLLECVFTWLLLRIVGITVAPATFLFFVVLRLVSLTLWFYMIAIFVYVIMSWFAGGYSPIGAVLADVVRPVLAPVRRFLPPIGGLDLSPLLVLILLQAASIALRLPDFLR
jgi:YggT family protein